MPADWEAEAIVGRGRPSSNLTKGASRDVRQEIARVAGASTGNVTKVKQVIDGVIPEIREGLLRGDLSIHRAWQWRTLSDKAQRDALWAHLNFNCHLHILVSDGGLREAGTQWHTPAGLDRNALMPMWRYAVITFLREALREGVLETDMDRGALLRLLTEQYERWWNIDIKRFRSKKQFLGYAGRYARRPPIAQHRFRTIDRQEVRFVTKDTRTKRAVETAYKPADFVAALADHVPDRYLHNVRYFGLLAPRAKSQTHDAVFALLGQKRLGKPSRLRWATSLQKSFGVDPLLDRNGERMHWVRRVPPRPAATSSPKTGPVGP